MRNLKHSPALPRLVLIRGLPGTGKTTLALAYVAKGYLHFETDQFFLRNGQYRFDKKKLNQAHAWCLGQTREALEAGEHVCVANVFAAREEITPYTALGFDYKIFEATHPGQSKHKVPEVTLRAMQKRWVSTEQISQALSVDGRQNRSVVLASGHLPNLSFQELTYGKRQAPWDLRRFLYRGGAGTNARIVGDKIDAGELGQPLIERVELVRLIHEVLVNELGRGGRRDTVQSKIVTLKQFFVWADDVGARLDLESIERSYLLWTDALLQRVRFGTGLSEKTAYGYGGSVGSLLDRLLGRGSPIVRSTRLRYSKNGLRSVSPKADKQNLEETYAFGRFLLDIADGLNLAAIWGDLPVIIPLRNGLKLEEWSGRQAPSTILNQNPKYLRQYKYIAARSAKRRNAHEADRTLRTRYPLVNLRIQAEMLMLMGQPAVNLAQVYSLRMDQWKFKPSIQGFEVRSYKHRRWGEVVFEIYPEYKKVFKRYLEWRAAIFPNDPDGLLFPLIRSGRHEETPPSFELIKKRCARAGIKYISPIQLRNTKANWMLRVDNDPERTADEMQHSVKTLLGTYEKPSQQRAMVQVKQFWAKADPARVAAGPGGCAGKAPEPTLDIPPTATQPDCVTPAGCLFCEHQRDIDSLDHFWSLASYRLLKSYELAAHRQSQSKKNLPKHPAEIAIGRLTEKLVYMKALGKKWEEWVKEALIRVEEGRYHPDWAAMIEDGRMGEAL